MDLDRLTGRPTLVNLWVTWCGPCREEMSLLQQAHARHGEQVRFLGVDVEDDPEAARWLLDELGIAYPHATDRDGELLTELGMRGLPVTLAAVDADAALAGGPVAAISFPVAPSPRASRAASTLDATCLLWGIVAPDDRHAQAAEERIGVRSLVVGADTRLYCTRILTAQGRGGR